MNFYDKFLKDSMRKSDLVDLELNVIMSFRGRGK